MELVLVFAIFQKLFWNVLCGEMFPTIIVFICRVYTVYRFLLYGKKTSQLTAIIIQPRSIILSNSQILYIG